MTLSVALPLPGEKIAEICRRHDIRELALFGSVVREDFRPDSDVDMLIAFPPDRRIGLFGLAQIQEELSEAIGRQVDLVPRNGLNPVIREGVLREARTLYAIG
jgi:predicted nucleotidyltransferase